MDRTKVRRWVLQAPSQAAAAAKQSWWILRWWALLMLALMLVATQQQQQGSYHHNEEGERRDEGGGGELFGNEVSGGKTSVKPTRLPSKSKKPTTTEWDRQPVVDGAVGMIETAVQNSGSDTIIQVRKLDAFFYRKISVTPVFFPTELPLGQVHADAVEPGGQQVGAEGKRQIPVHRS